MSTFSDRLKVSLPDEKTPFELASTLEDLKKLFPEKEFNNPDAKISNNLLTALISVYTSYTNEANVKKMFDLVSAILLTIKEKFPDLKVKIKFRVKSQKSFVANITKVLKKASIVDLHTFFDDLFKDVLAMKLIIEPTDISQLSDDRLYSEFDINHFIDDTIQNSSVAARARFFATNKKIPHTREQYAQHFNFVLIRLKKIVYPKEKTLYDELMNTPLLDSSKMLRSISTEQLNKLEKLAIELSARSSDRLYNHIAEKLLQSVCLEPMIKDTLHASCVTESAKKENSGWSIKDCGFAAHFSTLTLPNGIVVEGQSMNSFRFRKDLESHNTVAFDPSKKVDISDYFTLESPPKNKNNTRKRLSSILDSLNQYAVSDINTDEVQNLISKIKINGVLVKDYNPNESSLKSETLFFVPDSLKKFISPSIQYISPQMFTAEIKEGTDEFTSVAIKQESALSCFADVLRKDDELSILDKLILNYLKSNYPDLDTEKYYTITGEDITNGQFRGNDK